MNVLNCSYMFFTYSWLFITCSCINTSFDLKRSEERHVGKEIIPSCKIHMVEDKTLEGGPKGGGKEKLGEEE